MDIQTLVKTVIRTFEDAANLLNRIQQKRDASDAPALPEEPTNDLLNSLALGPVIVRGHYDHDHRRFGEPYSCGDIQAREQMKDVLISLQITLIAGLNQAWMDDGEIEYDEMQSVSDDSRVNAGVCLGQLSQRLSDNAKSPHMYAPSYGTHPPGALLKVSPPTLQYSSSRSTNSSGFSRAQITTPSTVAEDFASMKLQPHYYARPSIQERNTSISSSASAEQRWASAAQSPVPPDLSIRDRDPSLAPEALSMRRRSSHCLSPEDSLLLSASSKYSAEQPPVELDHDAYLRIPPGSREAFPQMSRSSSIAQSLNGAMAYTPDGMSSRAPSRMTVNDYPSYNTPWEARQARSPINQQSHRGTGQDYSTMEHVQYLQKRARPPIPDISRNRSDSRGGFREYRFDARDLPPHGLQRLQYQIDQSTQQTPIELYSRPYISSPVTFPVGPQQHQSPTQTNHTLRHHALTSSSISSLPLTIPRSMSITSNPSIPLTLPTDKNTLGFCKGAFRLFIGLEKKAFSINNRPVGISGVIPVSLVSSPLPGQHS